MQSFCRALLVLDVLYCLLAAAQEGLPGWHMFESVDRLEPVTDRDGRAVDVRQVLPKDAWLTDKGEQRAIVRFLCQREPSRGPYRIGSEQVDCALR